MKLSMKIFASLAALIHILFFSMESLLWHTPKIQNIFKMTPENAQITELMAFNQGFYNLFLALGVFVGLGLLAKGKETVGLTLIAYANICMLGAALVLLCSSPGMMRGVILQGGPPLIALASMWLYHSKQTAKS